MAEALKNTPAIPFRIPSGIKFVRVDAMTGLPASGAESNVIFEAFKPGTDENSFGKPPFSQTLNPLSQESKPDSSTESLEEPFSLPTARQPDALPPAPRTIEGTGGLY